MGGDNTWEVLDSIADCSDEELDAKMPPVDSTTVKTRCTTKGTTKKKIEVSRDSGSEEDETVQLTDADLMETSKQQDPSRALPEHSLSEPSVQVGSAKESTTAASATEKRTNGSTSSARGRRGKKKGVAAAETSSTASTVRTSKRKTRSRGGK